MENRRGSAENEISAEQVADLLEQVHAANGLLGHEMDRILGSRPAVNHTTFHRLTRLADELRPGADARLRLSGFAPAVVLTGTRLWMTRRGAAGETHTSGRSAAGRAAVRWSGRSA